MRGRVTKTGDLEVKRAGEYIPQDCPRNQSSRTKCNHFCPWFDDTDIADGRLRICKGIEFDIDTDRRMKR